MPPRYLIERYNHLRYEAIVGHFFSGLFSVIYLFQLLCESSTIWFVSFTQFPIVRLGVLFHLFFKFSSSCFYISNKLPIVNMKAIFVVMNTTWAVVKIRPEKNSGLCRIWTYDLCDTGAVKTVYCCLLWCSRQLCDGSKYHTFNFVKQNDTDELSGQAVAFLSILLFKWRVSLWLFSISESFPIESTY